MSSLLGFLGALGDSLGIAGSSPQQPGALSRFNNYVDPVAADQRAQANADQGALMALASNRQQGITNPQQNMNTIAGYLPQYTQAAAQTQAANPLASILQGGDAGGPGDGQGTPLAALSGDDLLKALPPSIASQVKGLSEGKIAFPAGRTTGTPYWQQMMQLVSQYDPNFDATNYNARSATRKDFTSGKSAQNITALNTAMGHLSSLSDAYDTLGNTGYPMLNSIANTVENQFSPDTQAALTNVAARGHAVSEELAKVFRSTGMAESDVKAWEDKLSTNASPAQSKALIGSAIELMNSRLEALGQQYNQGMGASKNGIELLSPQAQKAYLKLTGSNPQTTTASGNPAQDVSTNADAAKPDPVAAAKAAGYSQAEIDAYLKKKGAK